MRIAVIADAHANLPALQAALDAVHAAGVDAIYHVGDAIAIGPYPAECVDLLHQTPNLHCVVGNHERYFVDGLPDPIPAWMSAGEVQHQLWTHEQLGHQRRAIVARWPVVLERTLESVKTVFMHYGVTSSGNDFAGVVRNPKQADLDHVFGGVDAQVVFFGHDHSPSDLSGKARYLNPGSLGCHPKALAGYMLAIYENNEVKIQHYHVRYDDRALYEAFEVRKVPDRAFIYKVFFLGRFAT